VYAVFRVERCSSHCESIGFYPENGSIFRSDAVGREGYRLRVADWRVIFEEDERRLDVLDIGSRGSIYG
jgi:mRNA-degrading endonuclease RelE of RelBE toxin-antitoxin system